MDENLPGFLPQGRKVVSVLYFNVTRNNKREKDIRGKLENATFKRPVN